MSISSDFPAEEKWKKSIDKPAFSVIIRHSGCGRVQLNHLIKSDGGTGPMKSSNLPRGKVLNPAV